jgi:hypothetical protein
MPATRRPSIDWPLTLVIGCVLCALYVTVTFFGTAP